MVEPLRHAAVRKRTWTRRLLFRATRRYGKLEFEFWQDGPKCAGYTYYWLASRLVPPGSKGALSLSPIAGVMSSRDRRRGEDAFREVDAMAERLQDDVHDRDKRRRNMYYLSADMHRALTLSDNALHFFGERNISVHMLYHGDVSKTGGAKQAARGPAAAAVPAAAAAAVPVESPPDFNKDLIGWLIASHNDWRCGILSLRYEKAGHGEHGHAVGIYNGIGDETDLWQQIYFFDPNLGEFSFACQASFWEWLFRAYLPYFFDPGREEPRTYKYFKFAQLIRTLPPPPVAAAAAAVATPAGRSSYGSLGD